MQRIIFYLFIILPSILCNKNRDDGSYSYHKFRGPVSGEIQEVVMTNRNYPQYRSVDFVAKPDYAYVYGVQDPVTGNLQNHRELRDGDAVQGEYRVYQPDGVIRVVKYVADGVNGFRADISYEKS